MNVLALDPAYIGGFGLDEALILIIKVVAAFAILMVAVMLMIWFERKLIGDMQNRIGPNAGRTVRHLPNAGRRRQAVLQGRPDPRAVADRFVFKLAPYLSLVPAFLVFAVVPVGGRLQRRAMAQVSLFGHDDLPPGVRPTRWGSSWCWPCHR